MGGEALSCLNQSPTVPTAIPMPNDCMKRRYRTAGSPPKIAVTSPHHSTRNFVKNYSDSPCLYDSYTEVDWSINVSDLYSKSHCLKSQSTHILLYRHVTSHVKLTVKFLVYVNFLTYFHLHYISVILLNLSNNTVVFVSEYKWFLFATEVRCDWIHEIWLTWN